jgi:mono/diheme cytochrome c family protein
VIKDGKNVWKEGDEVQKCDACHGEAKPPTGKDAPKLSKAEKIKKYHYSAIHENCAGCHKANKKKGMERPGPTSCKECHPKKE